MTVEIRLEEPTDYREVEELTREAFWNLYRPGCDEHYTAHVMRAHPDFMPELTHVAELDGEIVGSIMYTRSYVTNENGERLETATFGPLCVHPRLQREGIGTMLIEHTKALAIQMGFAAIIILGDPHNYCKHGFHTGRDLNISASDGRYPLGLLVLELKRGAFAEHQWKFQESSAYEMDLEKAEEFDKNFPAKQKAYGYSQELFSMMVRSFVE